MLLKNAIKLNKVNAMLFKARRCVDTKSKKPNYHAILNYALFV